MVSWYDMNTCEYLYDFPNRQVLLENIFYPALVLFEQANCIDWIILFVIYCHWPKYIFFWYPCHMLQFGILVVRRVWRYQRGHQNPYIEEQTTPVFSGVRVSRSLVLCVCFVDRCLSFCTFSFGHCVKHNIDAVSSNIKFVYLVQNLGKDCKPYLYPSF
jgi:hypothetical protein